MSGILCLSLAVLSIMYLGICLKVMRQFNIDYFACPIVDSNSIKNHLSGIT